MDERKLIFIMTDLNHSIILTKSSPLNFLTAYMLLLKIIACKPNPIYKCHPPKKENILIRRKEHTFVFIQASMNPSNYAVLTM